MNLYDQQKLVELSKQLGGKDELRKKLDMVKCNDDLSNEEKRLNIEMIEYALTGTKYTKKQVLDDIEAGQADISDIKVSG